MSYNCRTKVESRNVIASLSGGLLRLMMATSIYFASNPPSLMVQFLLAEIVGYLTSQTKEGELMGMKMFHEMINKFKQLSERVAMFWENHRSFKFNLLMIW